MLDRRLVGIAVILAAAAAGVGLSLFLAWPFLSALTWAVVLAVVLMPVQRWLEMRLRSRSLAALASVVTAALLVCLPLAMIAQQLMGEAAQGARYLEGIIRQWNEGHLAAAYPKTAAVLGQVFGSLDPADAFGSLSERLTAWSAGLVRGSVGQLVTLVITFYFLFYLLRDRAQAQAAFDSLSPFDPPENLAVRVRFTDTVHATVVGTVLVAAVQGTLGGLMFWWLGLPAPAFWGLVMGVLAIVPVLGAFVVWVPAALYLALEGRWLDAALLVGWGGIIIAGIDNLLYPALVGRKLQLHTVVAFIGAVGGVLWLGPSGLVLGPALISVTLLVLGIARKRIDRAARHQLTDVSDPLAPPQSATLPASSTGAAPRDK